MHDSEILLFGIWSDMAVETIHMRHSHRLNGAAGSKTKSESVEAWTKNIKAVTALMTDLWCISGCKAES